MPHMCEDLDSIPGIAKKKKKLNVGKDGFFIAVSARCQVLIIKSSLTLSQCRQLVYSNLKTSFLQSESLTYPRVKILDYLYTWYHSSLLLPPVVLALP